jgi:tetratricopeptide (TPR) repeat protein
MNDTPISSADSDLSSDSNGALAPPEAATLSAPRSPAFERRLFYILAAFALLYSFLAGVRTVSDFDVFWQLATGRWVAQHHQVFSTDVFSYTAAGQPWIYPVGSGLLFYVAYLLGGYGLISWMGAAACCGTVAILLRRGSAVSAGIAIVAVPLIAYRTVPRADMFTVVLFAAYLSLLWENYQTNRARLWLLPLLMLAWVNLHLGFIAGLALLVAFMGMDVLEMLFGGERRTRALQRLRRELLWFAATLVATLANPWGWNIYLALVRQERAMAAHAEHLSEWFSLPLNSTVLLSTFSFRQANGAVYLVLAIAALAAILALLRMKLGPAILLLAAIYESVLHVRMEALTACIVVIIGGSILAEELPVLAARFGDPRRRAILATATAAVLVLLVLVRSADLVSNRHYYQDGSIYTFSTGLGWWLPEGAANFVAHANIPGEVFNTYEEGGYLAWRLGPGRRDYIDGRAIPFGPESFRHQSALQLESLDSQQWRQEAARYNINAFILPLARFQLLSLMRLYDFCNSREWRPVYLDELAVVFVRRIPATEDLIRRSGVTCASTELPTTNSGSTSLAPYQRWANSAAVMAATNRPRESLAASAKALEIFPDGADVHWMRGRMFSALGDNGQAEKEFLAAVSLDPVSLTWTGLADLYYRQGRLSDSLQARKRAMRLSYQPHQALMELAQYYLQIIEPKLALETVDEAMRRAPAGALAETGKRAFRSNVAQTRAQAYLLLNDPAKASGFQEEAVRLAPDDADAWTTLAKLYARQGRTAEQQQAEDRAKALTAGPTADNSPK